MEDVERHVKEVIAARLGADRGAIGREDSLVEDLGADSLDAVALIIAVEDEFNVDIPDEEAEQITTVKQLIEYVAFATEAARH